MAINKCNLVRGKEKEARECTEKLNKWDVGSHFNENLFMDSFFSSVSNGLLPLGVTLWTMHSPVWSQTRWGRSDLVHLAEKREFTEWCWPGQGHSQGVLGAGVPAWDRHVWVITKQEWYLGLSSELAATVEKALEFLYSQWNLCHCVFGAAHPPHHFVELGWADPCYLLAAFIFLLFSLQLHDVTVKNVKGVDKSIKDHFLGK